MIEAVRYRIGFAAYWLIFVALTAIGGRSPGLVMHPESVPYPWGYVALVSGSLGVLVAVFYLILLPPAFLSAFWRLGLALAFAAALIALDIPTLVTDMPGWFYVPGEFFFVTFIVLLVISGVTLVDHLVKKHPLNRDRAGR